jgi:hypothetical protein
MDMRLGAVVMIQNSAGCVCELREGSGSPRAGAAGVLSGALLASQAGAEEQTAREEEERKRRAAEEQEQRTRESVPSPTPMAP